MSIEALYPAMRLIHVFLDNARSHHAKLVQEWMARPGRRIRLHFIPSYCPPVNPIERLWRLMHANVTHNRCYATFNDFCDAVLGFLNENVPRNWSTLCDEVSDKRFIPLAPARPYVDVFARWPGRTKRQIVILNQPLILNVSLDSETRYSITEAEGISLSGNFRGISPKDFRILT